MTAKLDVDLNELQRLRDEGLSGDAIAIRMGISRATAYRNLRALGSDGTPPGAPECAAEPRDRAATLRSRVLRLAQSRRGCSIEEIANGVDRGPKQVRRTLDELTAAGHLVNVVGDDVTVTDEPATGGQYEIDIHAETNGRYRFGVVSDTHLCSKYERLDVLDALYDEYERQGIDTVYHAGNYIDGECRFNRYDLHTVGMDNQLRYFLEHYPQRKGIATHYISGDCHEGWYRGIDVGAHLMRMAREQGRTDLNYLGYMEADVEYIAPRGSTTLRLIHPGGGTAYAISYRVQKIVESLQGGEKPQALVCGHFHKSEYLYLRGVHCFQAGCCQDQTPFMRKKQNACHLGGWICELGVDEFGTVTSVSSQFFPFYDVAHHQRRWEYRQ